MSCVFMIQRIGPITIILIVALCVSITALSMPISSYYFDKDNFPKHLVGIKESPQLNADMVFGYQYDGGYISHQPKMIYSVSDDEDVTLMGWNADGQMTSMVQPNQDRFRKHMWDEAGQLAVAIGNEYCGYYGYNANGERVYKLTGTVYADQYNAGDVNIETYFDDIVLYVNPYMVVTPRGYTKHYYNGSERIAARLGDYWYNTSTMGVAPEKVDLAREVLEDRLNSGNTDEEYFEDEYYYSEERGDIWCEPYTLRTTYSSCSYVEDMLYSVFDGGACMADGMYGIDKGIFYYHSDHLGSASWITDDQGGAVQYLHYMPFGELWENQQASDYDERFKFTGKERDTETGYDYFGARFYSPVFLLWLSPDPLSDKYPKISAYAYCKWNPVNRIDPNGMDDWDLDIYGYIVNHTENTSKQDNVYLGRKGKDGEYIRFASKTFDHGLINEDNSFGTDITSFHVTDENTATELFLFLATENIQVEIGLINTVDDGSYLITDHEQSSIPLTQNALKLDKQGYQVSSLMHNHPKGHGPSTKDTKAAKYFVTSQGANVEHRVYNGYTYIYDRNNLTWKQNE